MRAKSNSVFDLLFFLPMSKVTNRIYKYALYKLKPNRNLTLLFRS